MCRRPGGVDFGGVQGVVGCQDGVAVAVVVGGAGHSGRTVKDKIGSPIQNVTRYWEGDSRT